MWFGCQTGPEERAAVQIPELDGAIPTSGGQRAFIRAKGERKDIVGMRLPDEVQALASLTPYPHVSSPAACRPKRSRATDGHRPDRMHCFGQQWCL